MAFARKLYGQSCLFPIAETFDVSFCQQTIGDMTLTTAKTSSGFCFHTPDSCRSHFLFITPKTGTLSISYRRQRLAIVPNRAFSGNLAETDLFELSAGVSKTSFGFPHTVVQQALSRWLGYEAGELARFEPEIELTGGFSRQLFWLLNEVTEGLGDGTVSAAYPLAAHQLSNAVLTLFLHGTPHSYRAKLAFDAMPMLHHPRKIRDAEDYIETHLHQPITVSDIAEAIGLTPRALQLGFRRHLNCSPMEYVQQRRLEGVRRELKIGGPHIRVRDVALRWGFFHLGRFAAAYKSRFGEAPSDTLSK
jgi:AraC-like DNA-binding protein